jgi:hypothetical protein
VFSAAGLSVGKTGTDQPRRPHLKPIGFVRDLGGGRTAIHWRQVLLFLGTLTLGTCLALLGTSYLFDAEIQWVMVLPQFAASMIYLIVAIEMQRQRIIVGKWAWRFSLAGMLWVTLFVAALLGIALNIAQTTQREFASGQKAIDSIEAITRSGSTYSQSRGGRFVVMVTRSDFDDTDLAKVIEAATIDGESSCRIISLVIWGTAVTDQGLARLDKCSQLEVLSTSVGPFSDATQSRLAGLRKLKDITLDESKFTGEELGELRVKIPHARINGR